MATDYTDDLLRSVNELKARGTWPVIVHGAGPQLNARLEEANVEVDYIDGMRVTDAETLAIARRVFLETNDLIVSTLHRGAEDKSSTGGLPRPVTSGVFMADVLDADTWKLVGDITSVNIESVLRAIDDGCVPVVTCMGETSSGQVLNVNADVAAVQLAAAMSPNVSKLVFVSAAGGLKDEEGKIIDSIDLSKEFESYMAQDWVKYGTRLKLKQFHELFKKSASLTEIAVTAPSTVVNATVSSVADETWGKGPSLGTVVLKTTPPPRPSSPAAAPSHDAEPIRVGLLGARGYVGRELLRLLDTHPKMRVDACVSRSLDKTPVSDLVPGFSQDLAFSSDGGDDPDHLARLYDGKIDCWVLAMPNGVAAPFVDALRRNGDSTCPLLVDLSADYRFDDEWCYGLPEHRGRREKLGQSQRISNPGCYATGAQMALLPLIDAGLVASPPSVFGVSGYSGAGTTPSNKNDVEFLRDNIVPYSLTNHVHEREVSDQLKQSVHFMPHVAPFFQGINLTCNVQLTERKDRDEIIELFQNYYSDEKLVNVVSDPKVEVTVKTHGSYRHGVTVGGFTIDPASNRVVIVSLIDNLLKGAATQCLQNMNLSLGLDEFAGIPLK